MALRGFDGHAWCMSPTYEHPTLQLRVTNDQRDRAESWLKEAYADGRVSESEFDTRIGQVLSAVNRRDLNQAFYGLVQVPTPSRALGVHPAYQPLVQPHTKQQAGRGAASIAHFSAFFLWLFGPAVVFALSAPGTYARREAAKAFNFTLIATIGIVLLGILGGATGIDMLGALSGLAFLGAVVLTIVGGAKALQGDDWRNPVKSVVKLEVLSENGK